ncbi:glycosyltransferase family 4 protein [Sphingobacterium siyangense]|uniref:Glycosyltransferase involved in cell wall biosynthesis n=1 Tax=Sphingobacterium siyangense TaxID=459529 RepID=A0A562M999_9SPHI|nr:glycosyltransferase family 4 protein [Sphingobacterium siyangense]TWI16507.1 glycosyltransferase involved in cell wall biosynthesis [Sphingobacterium siyangense]
MRILIIHTFYQDPGGEDTVFQQESSLLAQGHEVQTLTFQNKKGWQGALQTIGSFWNICAAQRVKKIIRTFKPDIVHVHNTHYAAGPIIVRTIAKLGIPQVMTLHNFRLLCPSATLYHHNHLFLDSLQEEFPWTAVRQKAFNNSIVKTFLLALNYWFHRKIGTWAKVNRYINLSSFAKNIFVESTLHLPPTKFAIKPNFVFPTTIAPEGPQAHFVYVGRLSDEKGILNLIDTFIGTDFQLQLIGGGPLENEVLRRIKDQPNISYLGFKKRSEILPLIAKAQALLVPSICFEGMPITILEAYSVGTAVLSSNLGPLPELIIPGKTGQTFDPHNKNDIIQCLREWSTKTTNEKDEIRKTCIAYYFSNFTPEINEAKLLAIYQNAIHDKKLNK